MNRPWIVYAVSLFNTVFVFLGLKHIILGLGAADWPPLVSFLVPAVIATVWDLYLRAGLFGRRPRPTVAEQTAPVTSSEEEVGK